MVTEFNGFSGNSSKIYTFPPNVHKILGHNLFIYVVKLNFASKINQLKANECSTWQICHYFTTDAHYSIIHSFRCKLNCLHHHLKQRHHDLNVSTFYSKWLHQYTIILLKKKRKKTKSYTPSWCHCHSFKLKTKNKNSI